MSMEIKTPENIHGTKQNFEIGWKNVADATCSQLKDSGSDPTMATLNNFRNIIRSADSLKSLVQIYVDSQAASENIIPESGEKAKRQQVNDVLKYLCKLNVERKLRMDRNNPEVGKDLANFHNLLLNDLENKIENERDENNQTDIVFETFRTIENHIALLRRLETAQFQDYKNNLDAKKFIDLYLPYFSRFVGEYWIDIKNNTIKNGESSEKLRQELETNINLGIPDYLHLFSLKPEYAAEKIISFLETEDLRETSTKLIIITLTDLIGAEETRNKLNDLLHKERSKKDNADQTVIDNLEYARSFITPNHEKIAVESLPDLYEHKIKFETYGMNGKMQEKEVALLEGLIEKDQKVLEAGMGTGRLFLEMEKAGYDITGYDFTQRHVALVRGEAPEAKVFKGDWKNNALQNESFDAVYSLGRNILHEYSLPDQVQMFREAARVLKKGGKFIFDIPDREKGEYKERVEDYANMMENKFQVRNYRRGAIYDSPNSVDFATRYAYSNEDIENLAQLAGFRIIEVRREELPTGKGDENLYYVLEKI